jgi:hypothetical protein
VSGILISGLINGWISEEEDMLLVDAQQEEEAAAPAPAKLSEWHVLKAVVPSTGRNCPYCRSLCCCAMHVCSRRAAWTRHIAACSESTLQKRILLYMLPNRHSQHSPPPPPPPPPQLVNLLNMCRCCM